MSALFMESEQIASEDNMARRKDNPGRGGRVLLPWSARMDIIALHIAAYVRRNRIIAPTGFGINRSVVCRLAVDDWLAAIHEGEAPTPEALVSEVAEYVALTYRKAGQVTTYFSSDGLLAIDRLTALVSASEAHSIIRVSRRAIGISKAMVVVLAVLRYARVRVNLPLGLRTLPPIE